MNSSVHLKFNIFLGMVALIATARGQLAQSVKLNLAETYRQDIHLREEFPNDLTVSAIFLDLDQDKIPEALVTSKSTEYEDGNSWHVYRLRDGRWTPIKGLDPAKRTEVPFANLFCGIGAFYEVEMPDGTLRHVALSQIFDKSRSNKHEVLGKTSFHLNEDGLIVQEEISSLESFIAYQGSHQTGMLRRMSALTIELLEANDHPSEIGEQNKAQHPTDGAPLPEKPKE